MYGADSGDAEHWGGHGDSRLREDLADAMLESPGAPSREKGKSPLLAEWGSVFFVGD